MHRFFLTLLLLLHLGLILAADPPVAVATTDQTAQYATRNDDILQKGGVAPVPRFTDNGNGTVTDHLTDLIWLKDANCTEGYLTWTNAIAWSNALASGVCGLSDGSSTGQWRLPNITELEGLFHSEKEMGLPKEHPFAGVQSNGGYWSSSADAGNFDYAWGVGTSYGYVYVYGDAKTNCSYDVWPVRESK